MKFDHLAFETENISGTVEFYRAKFPDTKVLFQDATWALITAAGVKIAFVRPGDHPAHIAYRVDSREELTLEAEKAGATIKRHRDASESFYIVDPAGNALEIIYYPEAM
jgi:catechol 2,3-dioxygenase-like lactoylglutathione lyase family enzyme